MSGQGSAPAGRSGVAILRDRHDRCYRGIVTVTPAGLVTMDGGQLVHVDAQGERRYPPKPRAWSPAGWRSICWIDEERAT